MKKEKNGTLTKSKETVDVNKTINQKFSVVSDKKNKARKLKDFSDGKLSTKRRINIISVFVVILIWFLLTRIVNVNQFLASPEQVWKALLDETAAGGRYWKDIAMSLQRVLIGFALSFVASIPIAFLMGWYPKFRHAIQPTLKFFRTIPPIALVPLVILALGLTEQAKYFIIFLTSFLVMVVTINQGIKEVDKTIVKAAYTFGATDYDIFKDIMMPAAFPFILVAARLGVSTALTTLIAAEITGCVFGVGTRIFGAQQYQNTAIVLLGIITIGVIGFILDTILLELEKQLTRWK